MKSPTESLYMLGRMVEAAMDQESRKAFGARLKSLRQQRNWLQKQVATKLGVKDNHYCKYEIGMYAPPIDKAIMLAKIFGVTLDYLLLGDEPDENPIHNQRLAKRFHAIEEFEQADQEVVVTLIDALIAKKRLEQLATPEPF